MRLFTTIHRDKDAKNFPILSVAQALLPYRTDLLSFLQEGQLRIWRGRAAVFFN